MDEETLMGLAAVLRSASPTEARDRVYALGAVELVAGVWSFDAASAAAFVAARQRWLDAYERAPHAGHADGMWRRGWWPVASDTVDVWVIDPIGCFGGRPGQLVAYGFKDGDRWLVWPSPADWVQALADAATDEDPVGASADRAARDGVLRCAVPADPRSPARYDTLAVPVEVVPEPGSEPVAPNHDDLLREAIAWFGPEARFEVVEGQVLRVLRVVERATSGAELELERARRIDPSFAIGEEVLFDVASFDDGLAAAVGFDAAGWRARCARVAG